MAVNSENEPPPMDLAKMSKIQKLAVLLVVIGSDGAAEILKYLDEHELDQVAVEMARYNMIPQELQRDHSQNRRQILL